MTTWSSSAATGAPVEVGGNDQWGNLVGGMDLIHKVEGESVHVMTNPLITKADGTKFGKTEGGAIWLNPQMLSPYAFYQFWLRVDDVDVVRFLKVFTFLDREEIERLERATQDNPKAREAQKVLAREVTTWVHGAAAVESAEAATQALWGRGELSDLDEATVCRRRRTCRRRSWRSGAQPSLTCWWRRAWRRDAARHARRSPVAVPTSITSKSRMRTAW